MEPLQWGVVCSVEELLEDLDEYHPVDERLAV
jgi:hypothetical protein